MSLTTTDIVQEIGFNLVQLKHKREYMNDFNCKNEKIRECKEFNNFLIGTFIFMGVLQIGLFIVYLKGMMLIGFSMNLILLFVFSLIYTLWDQMNREIIRLENCKIPSDIYDKESKYFKISYYDLFGTKSNFTDDYLKRTYLNRLHKLNLEQIFGETKGKNLRKILQSSDKYFN